MNNITYIKRALEIHDEFLSIGSKSDYESEKSIIIRTRIHEVKKLLDQISKKFIEKENSRGVITNFLTKFVDFDYGMTIDNLDDMRDVLKNMLNELE